MSYIIVIGKSCQTHFIFDRLHCLKILYIVGVQKSGATEFNLLFHM